MLFDFAVGLSPICEFVRHRVPVNVLLDKFVQGYDIHVKLRYIGCISQCNGTHTISSLNLNIYISNSLNGDCRITCIEVVIRSGLSKCSESLSTITDVNCRSRVENKATSKSILRNCFRRKHNWRISGDIRYLRWHHSRKGCWFRWGL